MGCNYLYIWLLHRIPHTRNSIMLKLMIFLSLQNKISLTHWDRVTHICVSKITIIGSDNGLSPGRRQAIILTNDGILLTGPLRTNFSGIWIQINTFSFARMHLKMSSGKFRPYFLGLNVLIMISFICLFPQQLPPWSQYWWRYWHWHFDCLPRWLPVGTVALVADTQARV